MFRWASTLASCACALTAVLSAGGVERPSIPVDQLLARVAEAVEEYYGRAQSLICRESVRLQSLGADLLSDASPSRQLDYDLRVEWDPATDGEVPEANVLRQLVKVNGRAPREKDEPGCMDPRAVSPEPLSMFLPKGQRDFVFTVAGSAKIDNRTAWMLDYRGREPGPVSVTWKKECFSIEMPGRSRGRAWIDAETGQVLRLDEHLTGMVDVTLPKEHRLVTGPSFVVVERLDSSVRYRPVTFDDPSEVLMLPKSITTVTVVRNAGVPRLRTEQVFSRYQRFLTGGRVVQ
ncbi:MAG TPA: hypothetical protein VH417_18465 [Vicinamibacterales bacterium]|jgi:hypothetical protein